MSTPYPKGPAIASGSKAVSESDSAAKLPEPDKKRKTQWSPFKVPDSKSIIMLSENKRKDRKEEIHKFLALPINEKTTLNARMLAMLRQELGEQEEEEDMENLTQVKSRTVLHQQTTIRYELKRAMIRRDQISRKGRHDLFSMERQKAVLEKSLTSKRSEIEVMDNAIMKEEEHLRRLEKLLELDNIHLKEFLRENEKKSVEARAFFEQEAKSKKEKSAAIKKLTAEIGAVTSEIADLQEILFDYTRYKDLLLELSPPEWKESQKAKALKIPSADNNDWQSEVSDPGRELPSSKGAGLSSACRDTVSTNTGLDGDNSEYEDEPEMYFTDPQQLLDLVADLTDKSLSLIQNSTRVEETAEGLRHTMEETRQEIENEDKHLTLQIEDISRRINEEKARGNKLKQLVDLHVLLKKEDQDVMWDALGEKVAEVHHFCVDDRITNLSTLEKLANIERRMATLLQDLENVDEESLEMMKKIKDSEKRSREREEKVKDQKEKQEERMRRYLERSMADSKKISGRKLMPRCKPFAQKVKVRNVDNTPAEDEMHSYLFTSDDDE
ncbi:cilia- and flagella-associated protein 100 isoform 1-T2 [Spinachia spinachia]